jgi:hypothetical protein
MLAAGQTVGKGEQLFPEQATGRPAHPPGIWAQFADPFR